MKKPLPIRCALFAALFLGAMLPSRAFAQHGPGNNMCGWTPVRIISGTVQFPTIQQNCFQVTLTTNVTSSSLYFPYNGEWVYITLIQDATGGRTFQPPPETLNWQPIDTRPYSDTPGSTAGVTTEMGYWDGTHFQIVGAYNGGSTSCSNGASDTRYVDSASGSDSNTGRNWCSAYSTEAAAVTALTGTGGWVYVAPDYTGAAATSVPASIHILETNQFDAVGPSVRRYSYPDWTADTENVLASLSMVTATPASTSTVISNSKIFGEAYKRAAISGSILTPSSSTGSDDSIGVLGISDAQGAQAQSTGVEGICYSELDLTDCSGVLGIAVASTGTNTASSLEAGWFQVEPLSATQNVDGVVARATSSNMPTANAGANLPTAAYDIRGSGTSLQSWLNGLYMEDWTTGQPIYLGLNRTPAGVVNSDRGNNGIMLAWQYDFSTEETSQMRVDGSTTAGNVGGDFQFLNGRQSSTVSLSTQVSGAVQIQALDGNAFSATPTFDRVLGLVQTITLTANVTSSTLSNCSAGQTVIFDVIENATGGFTFAWPSNFHGAGTITTTAGEHNRQAFYCDGTDVWSTGAMQSGT